MNSITANGKPIEAKLPCSIEEFLVAQNLLPRSQSRTGVSPVRRRRSHRWKTAWAENGQARRRPCFFTAPRRLSNVTLSKLFRNVP